MREIYIILGWVGWLWLPCVVLFALGYLKGERDERRRWQQWQEAEATAAPPKGDATHAERGIVIKE